MFRLYPYISQYNAISKCVVQFIGVLKSKSALMTFDRYANLKYKYGRRNFWVRRYFVDTVERNEKAIKEYIKISWKKRMQQKEYTDLFTGSGDE